MRSKKSAMATPLKIGALAVVVSAGFFAGRLIGGTEPPEVTTAAASAKSAQTAQSANAEARPGDDQGESPGASRATASVRRTDPGSYDALVSSHGLESKNKTLAAAFPDTDAGHRLTRMATLLSFGPAPVSAEGKLVADQVDWLKAHPADAFKGISDGLSRMPADYAQERQYLMQFAAHLDIDERQKLDFLGGQLELSTASPKGFDGAAALSALLEVARNPDEVEGYLRSALQKQRDAKAREVLLSLYSAREPDRGQKLRNELGIDGN